MANETILVIDDEKVILDLTTIILRTRGYKPLVAQDAVSAFPLIEEKQPALVLLDYMMPTMDGLSALKEIKERFPDTYVIMFTGKGSEEIAVKLMKAGANDYILKPFNNNDLVDRIEHVLRIRDVELRNRELLRERERLLKEIELWNRELENRVQEKTEALQKAQAEIVQSEKLATLGYLSAGMAHEIRNPLNSIALFAQLIKSGPEEAEREEYVDKILTEVGRIDGILSKLLNASKRPRFKLGDIRIEEVIDSTLEVFRPQIELHGIRVIKDYGALPPNFRADGSEIEQIFTNLFLNSIYEMKEGGTLSIGASSDGREIVITIGDTGRGIPPDHVANIFDPFFTTKSNGTGLGLSIVLRIVKTYSGKITVGTNDPKGTLFTIRLPLSAT